jgi:hypothetical protein
MLEEHQRVEAVDSDGVDVQKVAGDNGVPLCSEELALVRPAGEGRAGVEGGSWLGGTSAS